MKIGVLREEKKPFDKRVPLTPNQCKILLERYPNLQIVVQSTNHRCFSDISYSDKNIQIVGNLHDCDILLGVKEVPIQSLIPNKTYLFFSHTVKKQEYNRDLLCKMIELGIRMIDYELLKDDYGKRIIGFGRYAGIVGAYNAFLCYGLKRGAYSLKPAYQCEGRLDLANQLKKIVLDNEKIVITGKGRVGEGIVEIIKMANIKQVSINDFIAKKFQEPVFLHLDTMDYNVRIDSQHADKNDFYNNPGLYKSSFMDFAKHADIFIAGHFYNAGSPYLFTRDDANSDGFNIKVIADISCDIDGPVASTIRPSTIKEPIYGYNPKTEKEDDFQDDGVIAVMAVDNLPCELPKDSSEDFGLVLLDNVIPLLLNNNHNIDAATICENKELTTYFEYLRDYVNRV